jgi:hypothetical protein
MDKPKKYDVFLSYSRKNHPWVQEFVSALRNAGVKAWFDVQDIAPGDRWEDQVQDALRQSTTLVVILTPDSVSSPWTFFELGAALADGKKIIPVVLQDMDLRAVPLPLRRFQLLREDSPAEAGRRVAEVIGARGSEKGPTTPTGRRRVRRG